MLLGGLLVCVAVFGAGCDSSAPTVTVWHTSNGETDEVLRTIAQEHQDDTGTRVQVRTFDRRSALRDSLQNGSSVPDIIIGPHTWNDRLRQEGIANAYCLPGQCEICEGSSAPDWCKYAGGNFSHGRIEEMASENALCTEDQCPQCFGESPPPGCKVMSSVRDLDLDPARRPDLIQAGFSWIYPDGIFPIGIPIRWHFPVIGVNPDVIGDDLRPTTMAELRTFLREQPGLVYTDPVLDGDPVPAPFLRGGNGEPIPRDEFATQPDEAGILVTLPRRIPALKEKVQDLGAASITGYRPPIWATGGYVHADTDVKEEALNVMYRIADEGAQERFYEASGQLPAHGEVLGQVSEEIGDGIVEQGKAGFPVLGRSPKTFGPSGATE